jgi:hypothetical protein
MPRSSWISPGLADSIDFQISSVFVPSPPIPALTSATSRLPPAIFWTLFSLLNQPAFGFSS